MLSAVTLADWTRGVSFFHQRNARIKLAALVSFLIAIATTPKGSPPALCLFGLVLIVAVIIARLPMARVLARAAIVAPFAAAAAIAVGLTEGWASALEVVARSYLSALSVVVIAGTTPAPELFAALRWFGVPRALVMTTQFLYRFLAVVGEQAVRMRYAAAARRGPARYRPSLRAAAAISIAALFASAHARADRIHRAMLCRGYTGELHTIASRAIVTADWAFLAATLGSALAIRTR